ncbi:MAG: radical SAM protein [bacterium]|nr:radical SAM protein [bacterium]
MAVGFEGSAGSLIPRIKSISLFINNMCNLRCPYCYVSALNKEVPVEIKVDDIIKFINVVHEKCELESVVIVGREPLLSPKVMLEVLQEIQKMGIPKVGIITNGTLITKKIAKKLAGLVSFVDVSFDGLKEAHEKTRGRGSFAKTVAGTKRLLDAGIDVFVLHKVDSASAPQLNEFAEFMWNMGVKNIHIFTLYPRDIKADVFMDAIKELVDSPPSEMLISIKGDYFDKEILSALSDYICNEKMVESVEGISFIEKSIKHNSILRVMLENEPAEFRRGLRIDCFGRLVFCADQARSLKRPVGNISESLEEIFSRTSLIHKIIDDYVI